MHIIVSWDIKSESNEWLEINKELRDCLKGFSWAKPLKTFYIVKIDSSEERELIRLSLLEVCRKNPKILNLLISPIIEEEKYSGWLPKPMWDKIRERTEEDLYEYL